MLMRPLFLALAALVVPLAAPSEPPRDALAVRELLRWVQVKCYGALKSCWHLLLLTPGRATHVMPLAVPVVLLAAPSELPHDAPAEWGRQWRVQLGCCYAVEGWQPLSTAVPPPPSVRPHLSWLHLAAATAPPSARPHLSWLHWSQRRG